MLSLVAGGNMKKQSNRSKGAMNIYLTFYLLSNYFHIMASENRIESAELLSLLRNEYAKYWKLSTMPSMEDKW